MNEKCDIGVFGILAGILFGLLLISCSGCVTMPRVTNEVSISVVQPEYTATIKTKVEY